MSNLSRDSINALADRWAEIIWAISWQFCVLGVVVLLIHWLLRRAAPNWRYWLWQILAIKLLLMPFWTAALPRMTTDPNSESHPRLSAGAVAIRPAIPTKPTPAEKSPLVVNDTSPFNQAPRPFQETFESTVPQSGFRPALPDLKGVQALTDAVQPKHNRDELILVAPDSAKVSPTIEPSAVAPQPVSPTTSWGTWLMLAWVAGVAWYSMRIVWQGFSLSRRLRTSEPADAELVQRVRDAAAKLQLSRVPRVLILDAEISPFVCGIWNPCLVLPRSVTETFTPEQLDLVLLHELAHIWRRDLIWGWIPEIGRVLFFFHPLVYIVRNQIRFERELACDQLAMLSSGRDAATYADTLVRVVGQFSSGRESLKLVVTDSP